MNKIEEFINDYLENYEDTGNVWNYEDGCVFLGAMNLYRATKNAFYLNKTTQYINGYVDENGVIARYLNDRQNIDSINSGKVLFRLRDEHTDSRYQKAINFIEYKLEAHPRCTCGNFWHKDTYQNQVWLDGLYMALPFYAQYAKENKRTDIYEDILSQLKNVRSNMFFEEKKLYCHGWDTSKQIFWADSQTGRSAECWLRSEGWLLMALTDIYEQTDISRNTQEAHEALKGQLISMLKEAVDGLLQYQDADSKLFYQVPDYSELKDNYLETSGSAMVAYALMHGSQLGMLDLEYAKKGLEILCGIADLKLKKNAEKYVLKDACAVAGLGPQNNERRNGTISYYLSEPTRDNDPKGVGAFILAYASALECMKEGILSNIWNCDFNK